jgi:BlaI family transcriptional regulator, penicillinase repressor
MAEFGRRELELMQVLWRYGEQTAQEVRERLHVPLADPTVRTMLRILEEKGAVTHVKSGRAFVYRARVPAKVTMKKMLEGLIKGFFNGSAEALVAHLLDERELTPEGLEDITRQQEKKRAK